MISPNRSTQALPSDRNYKKSQVKSHREGGEGEGERNRGVTSTEPVAVCLEITWRIFGTVDPRYSNASDSDTSYQSQQYELNLKRKGNQTEGEV